MGAPPLDWLAKIPHVSRGGDVRKREVVALEQQGLAGVFRQCVGKTVAEVQSRWVIAPAELPPNVAGQLGLLEGDGGEFNLCAYEEGIQSGPDFSTLAALKNHSRLDETDNGHAPVGRRVQRRGKTVSVRFVEQHRQYS